jgi:hypothetical protein
MDTIILATSYNEFSVAMDSAIASKGSINAVLADMVSDADISDIDDRESVATAIAEMLAHYRGDRAVSMFKPHSERTENDAQAQKAVLNTIQYARTTANSLINVEVGDGQTLAVITKFSNRPKLDKMGKLSEKYIMDVELREKKAKAKSEPKTSDAGVAHAAVADIPADGLDDLMKAVVEKFGMSAVAEWLINSDEKKAA